jgi:peptidoglycan/LPS O-acetylase OafA/YrhL
VGNKDRIEYIDVVRGILIVLMIYTHTLNLANVSETSFFRSDFWLPRGWAFSGFIVLSGFIIQMIYDCADNYDYILRNCVFVDFWIKC